MSEFVRLEVEDGVGTIRLDRPKMNALNGQVWGEIRDVTTEAADRDDVRAVVLYGGEKLFAAGADIKEMAEMSYTDMVRVSGVLQASCRAVARIPKPVVAAVNGYALGGGCELALCADIRIAADDATFGQPEILVDRVVPPGAVYSEAMAWAGQFSGAATFAIRAAKESIDSGLDVDLETGLAIERQQFAALFATQDSSIGMKSFVESGPGKAQFVGA